MNVYVLTINIDYGEDILIGVFSNKRKAKKEKSKREKKELNEN